MERGCRAAIQEKKLTCYSGGALDTRPVLRVFLKSLLKDGSLTLVRKPVRFLWLSVLNISGRSCRDKLAHRQVAKTGINLEALS